MPHVHVESRVLHVRVDPLDHLLLLLDHVGQLGEDAAQLDYGALYRVHGVRPAGVVTVVVLPCHPHHGPAHVNDGVPAPRAGPAHVVVHGQDGAGVVALAHGLWQGCCHSTNTELFCSALLRL